MGYLAYDSSARVQFDDDTLAHVEVVVINKLLRKESFALSWQEPADNGGGRTSVWIDTGLPLRFRFAQGSVGQLDRDWLEQLTRGAMSSHGLIVVDRQGQPVTARTQRH